MTRSATLTTLALASTLAVAGCAGGNESPGTASDPTTTSAAAGTETVGASTVFPSYTAESIAGEHNDADVMFAQMMIPHHEQAVQMSEILLGKDLVPEEVRDLAERVAETQAPEIERMRAMLAAWDAPQTPEASAAEHGGHSSGMVDEQGMDQLRGAEEGPEAARLYLEQMTAHHEGAIEMAQDQVEQGSNPEALELAQEIVRAQEGEIQQMRTMLEELEQS